METVFISKPSGNILKVETRYYFRQVVPPDLRERVGRTEYKFSLRTSDRKLAKRKAGYLSAKIWGLFSRLRKENTLHMETLTQENIAALIRLWLNDSLEHFEIYQAQMKSPYDLEEDGDGIIETENIASIYSDFAARASRDLVACDYSDIKDTAEEVLRKSNFTASPDSVEYKLLSRELLKAQILHCQILSERIKGNYESKYEQKLESMQEHAVIHQTPAVPVVQGIQGEERTLSEFVDDFIAYHHSINDWSDATDIGNTQKLKFFVRIMENPKLKDITPSTLDSARNLLHKFPKNQTKSRKYKNWSLQRLKAYNTPEQDRASWRTIDSYCIAINSLFHWLQDRYDMPKWLDTIIIPPKKDISVKSNASIDIFTHEELDAIFHHDILIKQALRYRHQFWLPLLGAYTGARLEELAQLYLDDFQVVDDVPCILVTVLNAERQKVKRIKNTVSIRVIPIHPQLLDLNLWNLVEEMKKAGRTRLFEELRLRDTGVRKYSTGFPQWFGRHLKKIKIDNVGEGKKTFNSFRHTFIDYCEQHRFDKGLYERIVGHAVEDGGVSIKHYAKDIHADTLYNAIISKIDYGLDLSHLRDMKYTKLDMK